MDGWLVGCMERWIDGWDEMDSGQMEGWVNECKGGWIEGQV